VKETSAGIQTINPQNILDFATLMLTYDRAKVTAYLDALRASGATTENLYVDLLAPAAQRLGALWDDDAIPFTEVMVGLGHLQDTLHELSPNFMSETGRVDQSRRALLATAPGEQHTFGLIMVAEFFIRAGWDVWGGPMSSRDDLIDIIKADWFDVVGLSAGSETRLELLSTSIAGIRRASRNQSVAVMVGGPIFNKHPEWVARVGADGTAACGRDAPSQAESLVVQMSQEM